MNRVATLSLLLFGVSASGGCADGIKAEFVPRIPVSEQAFDDILKKYPDLTFQQLQAQTPKREYIEQLSFDPATVTFYDEAVNELQLTDREQEILRRQGFVSVDHQQRYSFGSLYFAVYTRDLPVLVTTDSILYAMHQSFDDMLKELEETYFTVSASHDSARLFLAPQG